MAYTNKVFRFGNFSFWFWILFIYILAALIWWFVSLERQSSEMSDLKLLLLKKDDPQYIIKQKELQECVNSNRCRFCLPLYPQTD